MGMGFLDSCPPAMRQTCDWQAVLDTNHYIVFVVRVAVNLELACQQR
jgi:hypothetical protein